MSSSIDKLAKDLYTIIDKKQAQKPSGYTTTATVSKIDDQTMWVRFPGNDFDTPVSNTVEAAPGDTVQVQVANGRALATGNASAPSTDNTRANQAYDVGTEAGTIANIAIDEANRAREAADAAETEASRANQAAQSAVADADQAKASAENASEYAARALGNLASVQSVTETLAWITAHGTMTLTSDVALDPSHVYFVVDANGDYYVGGNYYSVVSEPSLDDIATYYELSIDESLNNYVATHLAVDSEGLWIIPDAGGNKVLIATGQGSTYTSAGTYIVGASAVLAKFTADGSVIGVDDGTQAYLFQDYHSFQMINADGNTYFWVSDPRDREGYFIETFIGDGSTTVFKINNTTDRGLVTVKINDVEVTNYTHVGSSNIFTFDEAPSINDVITIRYHASWTGASYGFTYGKRADNSYIGNGSAVFAGLGCVASGVLAIASGSNSEATGPTSFARGRYAKAGGLYSHAEGDSVQTQRKCQTVIGEYNIIDTDVTGPSSSYGDIGRRGKYVFIIGNGMLLPGGESYRSNALTVDWDGNVNIPYGASYQVDGVPIKASGTPIPTANEVAEFDSTAHMNSTDMTTTEVDDFVDGLDAQGESLDNFLDARLNTLGGKNTGTISLYNCSGTVSHNNLEFFVSEGGEIWAQGRININSYVRSGANSGVMITLPDIVPTPTKEFWSLIGFQSQHPREYVYISLTPNSRAAYIQTSESFNNTTNGTLTFICSGRVFVK